MHPVIITGLTLGMLAMVVPRLALGMHAVVIARFSLVTGGVS
jgi:hypothetical protein